MLPRWCGVYLIQCLVTLQQRFQFLEIFQQRRERIGMGRMSQKLYWIRNSGESIYHSGYGDAENPGDNMPALCGALGDDTWWSVREDVPRHWPICQECLAIRDRDERLAAQPLKHGYPVVIQRLALEQGGGFVAYIPQLGLSAFNGSADTPRHALEVLDEIYELNRANLEERGYVFPEPIGWESFEHMVPKEKKLGM